MRPGSAGGRRGPGEDPSRPETGAGSPCTAQVVGRLGADFLSAHRDQLARTEQLIADAKADGRQRLVEMNEPIRLNLIRIVEGLEALEDGDGR